MRGSIAGAFRRRIRVKRPVGMFALGLALAAGCGGVTPRASVGQMPKFEARLERMRRDLKIPGMSAAIGTGQQITWSRGFGMADVARGVPATDTTVYHLASLTKTFASTIVMQLVEAGKLDLDAPVSDFGITFPGPSEGVIRVRHLITHTSEGVPGTKYSYNGDRFGRLNRVILRNSGQTFAERVTTQILEPLALRHTAPNVEDTAAFRFTGRDAASYRRNVAQGYSSDGRAPVAYPVTFGAAAGMMGSAPDMVRYSMAIDRHQFVRAETQAMVFAPATSRTGEPLPYALGWFVQTVRGVRVQWHYGYWTGNSSIIIRVPEKHLVFVLLANSDALSRGTTLGNGNLLSSPAARAFLETFVFE